MAWRMQFIQMRPARTEARQFPVVIARQHQIVEVTEGQAEVGRRGRRPTSSRLTCVSAHVVIGRDVKKEFAVAGPRKDIFHAHTGERARLLCNQLIEGARNIARFLDVDETNLAVFGEMLELAALALAGRGRTLRRVEFVPVVRERCDVGAARMRRGRRSRNGLR